MSVYNQFVIILSTTRTLALLKIKEPREKTIIKIFRNFAQNLMGSDLFAVKFLTTYSRRIFRNYLWLCCLCDSKGTKDM